MMENYDTESQEAGWDSPERAQKLVDRYIVPGAMVLDIGIGTGQAVKGYPEKGATVIGLDHDVEMLSAARAAVGELGLLRQADINMPLPIKDLEGLIDVAQAIGVLEFAADIDAVITQLHATLKQAGVFVFTFESKAEDGPGAEGITSYPEASVTVHRHTPDEIQQLLQEADYTLLSEEAYDGYSRGGNKVPYHIFLAQKL